MAGGNWIAQNKVRPGAYINFDTETPEDIMIGTRGIAAIAMNLDWGVEGKLIELTANDLLKGSSLAKIGLMTTEKECLIPNLALQNAQVLKIYRMNVGGEAAKLESGALTVTAKCTGVFGNKIAILITALSDGLFNVQTYANGYLADSQKAATIDQLVENDFVKFSGTGAIQALTSTLLTGGENGTVAETAAYEEYFELLRMAKWNTMAVVTSQETVIKNVINFIAELRNEEGKYVQAVIPYNAEKPEDVDSEGIINNVNGVIINDEEIDNINFVAWVAGATAGADINESNTGKVVPNATGIVGMLTSSKIVEGLGKGLFILSLNQDGTVKVEKDINSLHTFTEKSYIFSKNRVIRELDEIGSQIESIWERTYLGKVTNNEAGRTLFKSSIINYLTELQNKGAIANFDSSYVLVEEGADIDSVVASIAVKPLDSMEFLYMTVNIQQ